MKTGDTAGISSFYIDETKHRGAKVMAIACIRQAEKELPDHEDRDGI